MFDFHEKRKIRSVLYSRITIFMMFAVAMFLSISVYNRYKVAAEMGEKLESKQAELEALQARAGTLREKVEYLEDERGIEEELRNRFDVVKEGEQTVILIDSRETEEREKKAVPGVMLPPPTADVDGRSFFDFFRFWEKRE
jgi:cell division protein FtsB